MLLVRWGMLLNRRICTFLNKTRKKKEDGNEESGEVENGTAVKEQDKLRKRVNDLIKKQKLSAVRKILQSHDYTKPWTSDARAKVGSHLIEFLVRTAYIQSPANQQDHDLPDVRPAFKHTFKTVAQGSMKSGRKYGVIECDPLVRKGLEKTVGEICSDTIHANAGPPSQMVRLRQRCVLVLSVLYHENSWS